MGIEHDVILERLFTYLPERPSAKLSCQIPESVNSLSDLEIHVEADADFAGDPTTKRSTSGYRA